MSFSPKGKKPVGNPIVVVSGQRFGVAVRLTSQPKLRRLQIADNFFAAFLPRHPSDHYVLRGALPERARQGSSFFVTPT
jgi:hypothetical protein